MEGDDVPPAGTVNRAQQAIVPSDNNNERQIDNSSTDIDYAFEETGSLDENLEEVASRTNLTATNVKNILHHVLKDKRVLALVQKQVAEEEGREVPAEWTEEIKDLSSYAPKLTRSRVKQALASTASGSNISPGSVLPVGSTSMVHTSPKGAYKLLDVNFSDDTSSDEEYEPNVEEEEDLSETEVEEDMIVTNPNEGECVTGSRSSTPMPDEEMQVMEAPSTTAIESTPMSGASEPNMESQTLMQNHVESFLNNSVSNPSQTPCHESTAVETDEKIASRTRSKLPLHDTSLTSIEASFNPPDAGDSSIVIDLDEDDIQWQQWLATLTKPGESPAASHTTDDGDDQDDAEYNFLADQQEEEKEEFRFDKAVRIPQKEVAELLDELLTPSEDGVGGGLLVSNDGVDLTSVYLLETLGLQPPLLGASFSTPVKQDALCVATSTAPATSPPFYLSREQMVQLWGQVQKHFQLLLQTFLLARFEKSLQFLSQIAAQALGEMITWCSESKEGKNSPIWCIPCLDEAKALIEKLDSSIQNTTEFVAACGNPPKVPEAVQDIIMNNPIFWNYPELLPGVGFASLHNQGPTGKYFTTEEEYLLVLGMDRFGPSAWKQIQENLLPTKTIKQLQLRVKNQCSARSGENVIKYYKRTKKLMIPDGQEVKLPELPSWIIKYYEKKVSKEKNEEKKKDKEHDDSKKASKLLDVQVKPKPILLKPKTSGVPTNSTTNCVTPPGSKRNLCISFGEDTSDSKKFRSDIPGERRPLTSKITGQESQKNGAETLTASPASRLLDYRSTCSSPQSAMGYLVMAAGLEASDPTVCYACNYLAEVKAMLEGKGSVYEAFLSTLLRARQEKWRGSQIYANVKELLQPWPHLVKLFTEFLEPQDCLEANALADRYELESVKTFVHSIQEKYGCIPHGLSEATKTLNAISEAELTRETVEAILQPVIQSHEELIEQLRAFLYQRAPLEKADDVYEEVHLTQESGKEPDDFEQIALPSQPGTKTHRDQAKADLINVESGRPVVDSVCKLKRSSNALESLDKLAVVISHQSNKVKESTLKSNPPQPPLDQETQSRTSTSLDSWTREEDKAIIQQCQRNGISKETFSTLAGQLTRSTNEVSDRYHHLLSLFHSNQ
eukprot:Em0009g618a